LQLENSNIHLLKPKTMKKIMVVTLMIFASLVAGNTYGQVQKALTPSIGGKSNGTTITKAALVSAGKIVLNASTKKVSFFMMSYKNGQQQMELTSNSENLTPEMKTAINGLASGARIEFTKIACKPANDNNAAPERVGQFTITIQ
jgi:hypothetical protein